MRKLIVCNLMSLDGYYEGPGKNVLALFEYRREDYPLDESFDVYNAERLRAADTLLLGRASFEGFKSYWPPVVDNPQAAPIQREISRLDNTIDKVVVSDTLTEADKDPWRNTTIVRRADAYAHIAALKRQSGQEILMFASRTLWNDLLAHNLVDELHLMISPVIVGGGTLLFDGQPPNTLRLIDSHTWAGSGIVLVKYQARR
jgi:dihydrofolate reductase